jgi:hypothetical protein
MQSRRRLPERIQILHRKSVPHKVDGVFELEFHPRVERVQR